jgi:hypothetical protein
MLLLRVCAQCPCASRARAIEALYDATNGAQWVRPWDMTSASIPCGLEGVLCDAELSDVTDIQLGDRGLRGTLPDALSVLANLNSVNVSFNMISGTLPPSYGSFTRMQTFTANSNYINGSLCPEYSTWATIGLADFGYNRLTGSLPSSYGAWRLITYFNVGNNALCGTLPKEFSAWSRVVGFVVRNNYCLSGTLPSAYSVWPLVNVYFENNSFTGTFPEEYIAWSNMTYFGASGNAFNGTLPEGYSAWKKLEVFDVYANRLKGALPSSYSAWTLMHRIEVNNNSLNGRLPEALASWKRLNTFHAAFNTFSGTLPEMYATWTTLERFDVSFNSLNGTLSQGFSSWSGLKSFYAASNNLSGTLPSAYSAWSSLGLFIVQQNALTGTLPPEYSVWGNLQTFSVGRNQLTGSLPPSYSAWTQLTNIQVFSNSLSGTLPGVYGNMRQLLLFQATSNLLTGSIPQELLSISTLTVFGVGYNRLSGSLPLRCSPSLLAFMIQNNSGITGALPSGLSLFSGIGVCGTQVCPTTPYPLQYCIPDTLIFTSAEMAAVASQVSPYRDVCTPSPTPPPKPAQNRSTTRTLGAPQPSRQAHCATCDGSRSIQSAIAYVSVALGISGAALTRGALPSLQRSSRGLRMMERCNAPGSDDAPLYSALEDNPLAIVIPVGSSSLDSPAGAALGNAVLVGSIGVGLHLIHVVQVRLRAAASLDVLRVAMVLPSSLLPGSLAVAYGTLLLPSVGASVTLMASAERSAGTIIYGAALCLLWLALPVYCSWVMVWHGRFELRPRRFALKSELSTCSQRPENFKPARRGCFFAALKAGRRYAMEPTRQWVRHPRSATEVDGFLLENMEAVYGAYVGGREWYFLVQWTSAAVSGIVLGMLEVVGHDVSSLACATAYASGGLGVFFGLADAALVLALRPMSVRLEMWTTVTVCALSTVSMALALGDFMEASNSIVTVAALLELISMVLLMLQHTVWGEKDALMVSGGSAPTAQHYNASRSPDKRNWRHGRPLKPANVSDDVPVTVAVMKQRAMLLRLVSMACQQENRHNA